MKQRRSNPMGFIVGFIAGMALLLGVAKCSEAHEGHLYDEGKLTKIKMVYCTEGATNYIVVQTAELGNILLLKTGDINHQQIHYEKVDEFGCVYDIVED